MMLFSLAVIAAAVVTPFVGAQELNLVETISSTDGLSFIGDALASAGDLGNATSTFTVFAPNDLSFLQLALAYPELQAQLTGDNLGWLPHATNLVTYHIYEGSLMSSDLMTQDYTMLNGGVISVDADALTLTDISGSVATIGTPFDVLATDGVVHVIDKVFVPEWLTVTITDIAVADPDNFSILVDLVTRVDLATTLSGYGASGAGYTVFAPVNTAFEGIDATALTDEEVTNILLHHVVSGPVSAAMLMSGPVMTVGGGEIMVEVSDAGVKVDEAMVTAADVLAKNGLIHVIDKVLMPPAGDVVDPVPTMAPVATGGSTPTPAPVAAGVDDMPSAASTTTTVVSMFSAMLALGAVALM